MRLILTKNRNGVGAMQLGYGSLHGFEQVGVIQTVHQVGNDLGIGLADKHIALGLERSTQFVVVFDDAVVHQRNTPWPLVRVSARAMAKVGVRIADRWHTVRGPARVGNAQISLQLV